MDLYFYLEWFGKRPQKIEILQTKPRTYTFHCKFQSSDRTIQVYGNFGEMSDYIYSSSPYKKNQYLMSHLQKCVRRMETKKAVQTAKHLIDLDIHSFLRRLPIIIVEDVKIHSSICVVIWLMIAVSKKYILTNEQIKWLLGVVYSISENKDPVVNYQKIDGKLQWDMNTISNELNTFLWSLRFRQNYGGMKGDMKMIEDYIYKLYHKEISMNTQKIPIINMDAIKPLLYKDWIYQANDFHCNKSIIQQIISYVPEITSNDCKKLIWIHSSSENKRDSIKELPHKEEWNKIKPIVKRIQKRCIFY
jgi:hypothetical protein